MTEPTAVDVGTPAASSEKTDRGPTVAEPPRARRLFRFAVLLALTPIASSAVRNGASGWFPTRDAAYTTVWIRDVFSPHTPLHGQPMRFPPGATDWPHYLGVVHHYLLAIPVELFGVSWGVPIGMAVLDGGWVLMALWLIRRRVGYRWGLVGCGFVTLLVWSLGSQMLIDPTPVQTGPLAFFAFCIAAWSVAETDPRGLVPLALTANYLFLTHPQYVLVVPAATAFAVGIATLRVRRVRARAADRWPRVRRRFLPALIVAGAATVVMWAPAVIDQVFRPGGNLRIWFFSMLHQSGDSEHGIIDTIRVVTSPLTVPPFWFRPSLEDPPFSSSGPTANALVQVISFIAVAAAIASAFVLARRRADRTVVTGIGIGAVAWLAWVTTVYRQPGAGYMDAYLVTSWPLAAFTTVVVTFAFARCRRVRSRPGNPVVRRRVDAMVVVATALVALAALPTVDFGVSTTREAGDAANHLRAAIRQRVEPGPPVLVEAPRYPTRAFLPVAVLELEDMGIPVRLRPGRETMLYRSFRGLDRRRPDAGRRLVLTPDADPPTPDAELIASAGTPLNEPIGTYRARRDALEAWAGSTTIRLAPTPGIDPDQRRRFDDMLAEAQAEAGAEQQTVFSSEESFLGLLILDGMLDEAGEDLTTLISPPGMTTAQFRAWLEDHATVLGDRHHFVYLDPLRGSDGT